jgi:hypothetical protein
MQYLNNGIRRLAALGPALLAFFARRIQPERRM